MCKECRKLLELFAETQLECLKNNRTITKIINIKCQKCGQDIYVVADTIDNNVTYVVGDLCKND